MQLNVRLHPSGQDRTMQLDEGADGLQLLGRLNLNPEAHLIIREGKPVPVDLELRDGDQLSIVTVISGG